MNGAYAHRDPGIGRLVAGGILILLGIVYALDSFGVLRAGDILRYWPLILIGVGVQRILQARHPGHRIAGLIMVAVGSVLLLRTLRIFILHGRDMFPIILLLIGGGLVWQALTRRSPAFQTSAGTSERAEVLEEQDKIFQGARERLAEQRGTIPRPAGQVGSSVLNEFAFMGGGDRVVSSQDFRGGEITAIMGGYRIDLRGARIAGDSATLHVFTFWGGVDLRVPEDWNVVVAGTPILGMFTSAANPIRQGDAAAKTLFIKGVAIMGGVEVKN